MITKPELNTSSVPALLASFVEKWCPQITRAEFAHDLWTVVNFEKERCAVIAEDEVVITGLYHPTGEIGRAIALKIRDTRSVELFQDCQNFDIKALEVMPSGARDKITLHVQEMPDGSLRLTGSGSL